MRGKVVQSRARRFLEELGRAVRGPGRVCLTGGASAVPIGWRESTIDVDLRLDPAPDGVFEAIARIKDELDLNVELASPQDFLPELPGWRDRSKWIGRFGEVEAFHYDFYAQALSKIARGHDRDIADVHAMAERGLIEPPRLLELFEAIEPHLPKFPSLDPRDLRARVEAAFEELLRG